MKIFVMSAAFALICGTASAQVPLSQYADKDGYVNVQKLTCGQLAGTFQEDADLLAAWYSGWYNGLAKAHRAKITRVKDDLHEVIVYCKANQKVTVIKAIDTIFKKK
ncbi:MAG: HdeA/HdeB family chaperone [Rhodocyclaceae bacterium]